MSDQDGNDRDDSEGDVRLSRERRASPDGDDVSSKPNRKSGSKEIPNIGKKVAEKSGGLFSPEDWMCKSCGNINWARRSTCNMCNMPRYQKAEARTGAGGGYNERDNVEYNERQNESDGEYDEFGRRKKKAHHSDEAFSENKRSDTDSKSRSLGEDDDEDDDDDEFDAKKYALDSDDDDDDDKNHQQASSSNDKRSNRSDRESSPTHLKQSSSRRNDDHYTRRRSRSRSPVSSSKHKSSRH